MADKYEQAKFEQYSQQMGYGDFEEGDSDDGRTRYRNPNTQARWNFWVASRDALSAPPPAGAQQAADEAVFAIVYDDHDRRPEIVVGQAAAEARFERISASWNAHLFGKLKSNSRDDAHASNNIALAAPAAAQGAAVSQTPAAPKFQWTDGTYTLKQDVLHAIHVYADSEPEKDPEDPESWESWFEAAFDLLGSRVGDIFDEHEQRAALAATPAPEAAPSAKEGEADTARLDWIVRQGDEFSCSVIVDAPDDGEYRVHGMDNAYGQGKTAREAIDAAIKGLTPAGGDRE